MKNILFFMVLVIVAITGTSIVLTQNTLASSTHMTLHNLTNETAELWAEIPVDPPHCDAEPNLTCEAGTEYNWYTINVAIPNSESPTWEQQLFGVFGECDVYITDSDGKYDAQHHCSSAEKLGLKPPADNKTK
jgi:hypothetical protein